MEQRTRILHHTRSKTPIILSPNGTQTQSRKSGSPNAAAPTQRRSKAPLASVDAEISTFPRRNSRSCDQNRRHRSSSSGRPERGSQRIVSRDVLKSDQISDWSDWSDEDGDRTSSVPVRRHTMGSVIRRSSNQSNNSSSDRSIPSSTSHLPSSSNNNEVPSNRQRELDLNGRPRSSTHCNGYGVHEKLPGSQNLCSSAYTGRKEINNTSESSHISSLHSHVPSSPTMTSPLKGHTSPHNVVYSRSNSSSSDTSHHYSHSSISPNVQSRPNRLLLNSLKGSVPTSKSLQLSNTDSVTLSSPGTALRHTVSSHKQSISHPHPSPTSSVQSHSVNANQYPNSSPKAVSSPSTTNASPYSHEPSGFQTPTLNSNCTTWRSDPRRRPFQVDGQFALSPEEGPRIMSPTDDRSRKTPYPGHISSPVSNPTTPVSSPSPRILQAPNITGKYSNVDSISKGQRYVDGDSIQSQGLSRPSSDNYETSPARSANALSSFNDGQLCLNNASNKVIHNGATVVNSHGSNRTDTKAHPQNSNIKGAPKSLNNSFDRSSNYSTSSRDSGSSLYSNHKNYNGSNSLPRQNPPRRFDNVSNTRCDNHPQVCEMPSNSNTRASADNPYSYQRQFTSHNGYDPHSVNSSRQSSRHNTQPICKSEDNSNNSSNTSLKKGDSQPIRENGSTAFSNIQGGLKNASSPFIRNYTTRHQGDMIFIDPEPIHTVGRKRDSFRMATEGGYEWLDTSFSSGSSGSNGSSGVGFDGRKLSLPHQRAGFTRSLIPGRGENNGHDSNFNAVTSHTDNNHRHNSEDNDEVDSLSNPFVRGCRQRDSYRLATCSNPDLTCLDLDRDDEIFASRDDILTSSETLVTGSTRRLACAGRLSDSVDFQSSDGRVNRSFDSFSSAACLKPSNTGALSPRIKRNSLRLATASLSDLSVILDEIDIDELPFTPSLDTDSNVSQTDSPLLLRHGVKYSPLVERSLGRSGSNASSRNSSSFGSFYSCHSKGFQSASNSPHHTPSLPHSSPSLRKAPIRTPDSVHKLIAASAHDSGISQSSEDTNSFQISANSSSADDDDCEVFSHRNSHNGSSSQKRPAFYWTRQTPSPHQSNSTSGSFREAKQAPSRSNSHCLPKRASSGSIRSYGSSSSVESSSRKTNSSNKQMPSPSSFLHRYGCGLDGKSKNTSNSSGRGDKGILQQRPAQNTYPRHSESKLSTADRGSYSLPIPIGRQFRPNDPEISFDDYAHEHDDEDMDSPIDGMLRSPPSLGRPRRKMYAGFDSQPLPMDSFMSDSSSIYTTISCSSRGTEASGQPDSGTFDDSFYSIDNRSLIDEACFPAEASLDPREYVSLTEIHKNAELCRTGSIVSTSTAKEGDGEMSDEEVDAIENIKSRMDQRRVTTSTRHEPPSKWADAWSDRTFHSTNTSNSSSKRCMSVTSQISATTFTV